MDANDEVAQVKRAIQARPADFEARDVQPLRLRRPSPPSPTPVPRRTVFQPGSDWSAPSTTAVLDALHSSYAGQARELERSSDELALSRCAGSVAVDAAMADLFDAHVGKPAQGYPPEPAVVQCKNCLRPVLVTRFLAHREHCVAGDRTARGGGGGDNGEKVTEGRDSQLELICAPYGGGERSDGASSVETAPYHDASAAPMRGRGLRSKKRRVQYDHDTEMETDSNDGFSFPPDEDDWETSLITLAPKYVPRGATVKRRRIALPSPTESNSQRKRSLNTERKAVQAAGAAGIFPIQTNCGLGSSTAKDVEEDPLTKVAKDLGDSAPWSKLMQTAMPITVPRNPKARKPISSQDYPSGGTSYVPVTGITPTLHGGSANKGKPGDVADKYVMNVASGTPSLVGSLMWIRAQGIKELSNTALYNMDTPQPPVGRSGAIFHGQTYVAELGTFETDPRAQTTIRMPLAAATPLVVLGKPAAAPAPVTKVGVPADSRSKKHQGVANTGAVLANAVPHPPVSKKQRTTKAQRVQMSSAGSQPPNGLAQSKPGQGSTRKSGGSVRAPAGMTAGNVKSATNSYDSQHRPSSARNAVQLNANNATSAALANASAAAAKYATQQLQQQKKGFRPVSGGGSVGMPARVGQSLPTGLGTGVGVHMTSKGGSRGSKARPHVVPMVSNPSPVVRAPGNVAKTPSPSQGSSRSGERLPMHRGSPMSAGQYDPVLLASSVNAATSGINRVGAIRGAPGKAQLDFQQAMAQVAGQGVPGHGRETSTTSGPRPVVHQSSSKGQLVGADKIASQLPRGNIRGMAPQSRVKQNGPVQNPQQRLSGGHKNNSRPQSRGQVRKDELQKAVDIEAQLRRTEAPPGEMIAGKGGKMTNPMVFGARPDRSNLAVNHAVAHPSQGLSQGFYTAALAAAASAQHGTTAAMKTQANNIAMFRMAQNPAVAAAGAAGAPNMLQNLHDMRLQPNLGVMPGMQAATHNPAMLSFMQAPGMNGGIAQTGSMHSAVGGGIPAGAIPTAPNPALLSTGDAILQQLLGAGRGAGLAPNAAALHGQAMGPPAAQLGHPHPHQVGRTAAMAPPRPVVPTAPNAAMIDEIDRALGLSFESKYEGFDESDLMD